MEPFQDPTKELQEGEVFGAVVLCMSTNNSQSPPPHNSQLHGGDPLVVLSRYQNYDLNMICLKYLDTDTEMIPLQKTLNIKNSMNKF